MKNAQLAVNKINELLQEFQNKGVKIRNRIVVCKNRYKKEMEVLLFQQENNNKKFFEASESVAFNTHNYKRHNFLAKLHIAVFFTGCLLGFMVNPMIGGALIGLSMPCYFYNSNKARVDKTSADKGQKILDECMEKNSQILEQSYQLQTNYKNNTESSIEELRELYYKFFTLKNYKERIIKEIIATKDKNFKDEKSEDLNFELPLLF